MLPNKVSFLKPAISCPKDLSWCWFGRVQTDNVQQWAVSFHVVCLTDAGGPCTIAAALTFLGGNVKNGAAVILVIQDSISVQLTRSEWK